MRRNGNGHDTSLQGLIDLYLLRCQVEGKSPSTIHAYAETLGRFLRFVRQEGFPEDVRRITPGHLYPYLGQFAHLSLETRHRYFREVRCFFNWLLAAGYIGESPFRSLRNVRLPQKIVRPFSAEDIVRLLACSDPGTAAGARDRAIVLILLDTGVRCSELVQLTLDDLDLEAGRPRVLHGKGNKDRVVPFASCCREALEHYLALRRWEPGPLFFAVAGSGTLRRGIPLQSNGLKQLLRRLGRQAGLSKVHAHRFRHTFATWAIEQDARELDVQYLLGHASPDMVRRYASTYNSEQAARRHVMFSPAERLASLSLAPFAGPPEAAKRKGEVAAHDHGPTLTPGAQAVAAGRTCIESPACS
jgi:integrase